MSSSEEELWKAIKEGRLVDAKNLIASGADTRLPNHNDNELTALDYSQLTGDINFFKYVSYKNREINVKTVTERFPSLVETFLTLPDFQMNFKWRVYSWVPFISAFCPKDEWKLTKVGGKLRIDTSLANWSGFRFTKGSISVFFDASTENMLDSFIAIDNVSGERISVLREMVTPEEDNQNVENINNNNNSLPESGNNTENETPISSFDNDINNLMKMDLLKGTILVDNIQRKEVLSGIFHKKPKTIIHDNLFHATEYELEDIKVRFMQYYFEDFGKDEIFNYENGHEFKKVDKKKKEKRPKTKKGGKKKHENQEKEEKYQSDSENINDDDFDNANTNNNRNTNNSNVSNDDNNNNNNPFKDYNFNDENDNNDDEGKNHNKKHSIKPKFYEKTYSGKFWCARDFPVQVWTLYPFLEALAPFKETPCNVIKVLDFFDVGTPVKAEISVFPTVKVEFQFCNYNGNVDEYREYVNQPPPPESAQ